MLRQLREAMEKTAQQLAYFYLYKVDDAGVGKSAVLEGGK